jgi:cyclin C
MAANFWTSTHCRHWLFDKQTLRQHRETSRGSFSAVESEVLNEFFVMVIQAVGKRLGWRQPVIATAVIFFKRFYVVSSLSEFDPRLVVPTAMYLAAKVEEMGQIRVETVTEVRVE